MVDSHCHLADAAFAGDLDAVVGAGSGGRRLGRAVYSLGRRARRSRARNGRARRVGRGAVCGRRAPEPRGAARRPAGGRADARRHRGDWRRGDRRDRSGLSLHLRVAGVAARGLRRADRGGARPRPAGRDSHARGDRRHAGRAARGGAGARAGRHALLQRHAGRGASCARSGCFISLSGIVSFPKAAALRDLAAYVPEDRLLVETDAPYLAPVPHRGKRNEPAWVAETLGVVAAARGVAASDLAAEVTRNFRSFIGTAK